jgi:RND family efflux transporter MFP subunit
MSMIVVGMARAEPKHECLIEPVQAVEIRSPVVGLLEKVHVRRGDRVRKGQVIAVLESNTERAAVDLARFKSQMTGQVATAENKIEFSKRKFQRRRDMYAEKLMSGQDKDDTESELKLAESELQLAKENKQLARIELQQQSSLLNLRTIRSPFDGVVVDQILYPGEVVEPSADKKPILKLAQINPLRVHVILPIAQFNKIKPGMTAGIISEPPINGRYTGRITIVDRLIDAASGTFGLFVELPNPKYEIPAGIKCRAEFQYLSSDERKNNSTK